MNKFLIFLNTLCVSLLLFGNAQAAIALDGAEASPAYWTSRTAGMDKVLLDTKQIQQLNTEIRTKINTICDMKNFPATMTGSEIKTAITASLPELRTYYTNGRLLTDAEYQQFARQAEASAPAGASASAVRYAVTIKRADLRLLPTSDGWFDSPDPIDAHYDNLQATAVDPSEPLAVLADSADGTYAFVQMRYYRGWIAKAALAFTNRPVWLTYTEPKKFLVVTTNRYEITQPAGSQLYQLGSKIPLAGQRDKQWLVRLPQRNAAQQLIETTVRIPMDTAGLHEGFLPYTRANILRSGFTLLGDVYGWGGVDNSVDCSSLIADVFRTVGIELPRDSDQQEIACPQSLSLKGLDIAARHQALTAAQPGAILFRSGHVMLYLGQNDLGNPCILHSASSVYTQANGQTQKHYIRQVIVSDLNALHHMNNSLLTALTSIGSL